MTLEFYLFMVKSALGQAVDEGLDAVKLALEIDPVAQGKQMLILAVIFGYYMARDKEGCLEQINNLEEIDFKSWLLTTKICRDEEHEFSNFDWFQEGKKLFSDKDFEKEVRFSFK